MFHIFCKSLQPCAPPMENTLVQCSTDFGGGRKNGSKCCIIFREIAKSSFMGGKFEQNIYYIVEERVFHELSYFVNFLRNNQQFLFHISKVKYELISLLKHLDVNLTRFAIFIIISTTVLHKKKKEFDFHNFLENKISKLNTNPTTLN